MKAKKLRHPEFEGKALVYAILTDKYGLYNGELTRAVAFGHSLVNSFENSARRYTGKSVEPGLLLGVIICDNKVKAKKKEGDICERFCTFSNEIYSSELTFYTDDVDEFISVEFMKPDIILQGLTLVEYVNSAGRVGNATPKKQTRKRKQTRKQIQAVKTQHTTSGDWTRKRKMKERENQIIAEFTVDTPIDTWVEKLGISQRQAESKRRNVFRDEIKKEKEKRDKIVIAAYKEGYSRKVISIATKIPLTTVNLILQNWKKQVEMQEEDNLHNFLVDKFFDEL